MSTFAGDTTGNDARQKEKGKSKKAKVKSEFSALFVIV
jgi:hypothetical protein